MGDDEVDYSVIKKFGRTVGKEKIEKNTPIFEALTNQNLAQKYRLISVSNPNLIRLPTLSLESSSTDIITLDFGVSNSTVGTSNSVKLQQTIQNESSIDVELRDQAFEVSLNNLFLQISGQTPDSIDGAQRARYLLPRDPSSKAIGSSLSFQLLLKSITHSQFLVYGTTQNKRQIKTYVKVTGLQSGATKEFTVVIRESGSS